MNKTMNNSLFFYQIQRLITIQRGGENRTIMRGIDVPLAARQTGDTHGAGLLATDNKGSVLSVQSEDERAPQSYSAYGHNRSLLSPLMTTGFNGEVLDPRTLCYILGQGYRLYSPHLGRFRSPDNLSPFGKGGLNAYAYCTNDPVNAIDPSGHAYLIIETFRQKKLTPIVTAQIIPSTRQAPAYTNTVRHGKKILYLRTLDRPTTYTYSTQTLVSVQPNKVFNHKKGTILSERLPQYEINAELLSALQDLPDDLLTDEHIVQKQHLLEQQRHWLNEGGELLRRALDPRDLMTHVRENPRTTPGSSRESFQA